MAWTASKTNDSTYVDSSLYKEAKVKIAKLDAFVEFGNGIRSGLYLGTPAAILNRLHCLKECAQVIGSFHQSSSKYREPH